MFGLIRKILRKYRDFIRSINRRRRHLGTLFHFILTIIGATISVLIMTTFCIILTTVDGESMEPNLIQNDRLVVLKFGKFLNDVVGADYVPKRGQIVIFYHPGLDKQVVKRVIGLPNEKIIIQEQKIIIYNQQNPQGFEPKLETKLPPKLMPEGTYVARNINRGEIFVVGDNRLGSDDSRDPSVGNIPLDDLLGNVWIHCQDLFKCHLTK